MDLYKVTDQYISLLQSIDSQVLDNKNNSRPYVGIFIRKYYNNHEYTFFVPLSSSKNSYNKKRSLKIVNSNEEFISHLRFDKMIPVTNESYAKLDINNLLQSATTDAEKKYARLLFMELAKIRISEEDIVTQFDKVFLDMTKKKKPNYLRQSTNIYKIINSIFK